METFLVRPDSPESKPFGLPGAELLSVSRSGEMAVARQRRTTLPFLRSGTLARLSLTGGTTPRDVLEAVEWADWSPDGRTLAVVRAMGWDRLEYPIGKVLYKTGGWIAWPRVSPDGKYVAFIDHPTPADSGGAVAVVDRAGKRTVVSPPYEGLEGVAWSPRGEIWFTAARIGTEQALYSTSLSGKVRLRARVPGMLVIQDISADGRVLVVRVAPGSEMSALAAGDTKERDLTWLDWSSSPSLSKDGRTLLFSESGAGGGSGYSVYLRKLDGSPAVRLGEGSACGLSPDGRWALAVRNPSSDPQFVAYPTGAGEPIALPKDAAAPLFALFMPDGKRIVATEIEKGSGPRIFLRGFPEGPSRPISPPGYFGWNLSPDGRSIAALGPGRKLVLISTDGGEPRDIPGIEGPATFPRVSPPTRVGSTHSDRARHRRSSFGWTSSRDGASRGEA
jgi:Tol biopolymer transport system component